MPRYSLSGTFTSVSAVTAGRIYTAAPVMTSVLCVILPCPRMKVNIWKKGNNMRALDKKFYEAVRFLTGCGSPIIPPAEQIRYHRALHMIEGMWNDSFGSDIKTLLAQAGVYDWGKTGAESRIDEVRYSRPNFHRKKEYGTVILGITVYNTTTWKEIRAFEIGVRINPADTDDPGRSDIRITKVICATQLVAGKEVILWEE